MHSERSLGEEAVANTRAPLCTPTVPVSDLVYWSTLCETVCHSLCRESDGKQSDCLHALGDSKQILDLLLMEFVEGSENAPKPQPNGG